MGHRCEMCAGCHGLHAPASALRRPGYLWEIAEDGETSRPLNSSYP